MFTDIKLLIKRFKAILMQNYNIYKNIIIVIAFNSIYYNFETKILILFKTDNIIIDKIQQILYFAKLKNLNK